MGSADISDLANNPYLLLTPGPLSTTRSVKRVMMRDWCTWDEEYNAIVQGVRNRLVQLAGCGDTTHTAVLMQGSGTFCVESVITSILPRDGKLLVLSNGAYGRRMARIAEQASIEVEIHDSGELEPLGIERLKNTLETDGSISHVAAVHCETTTGMLNPISRIGEVVKKHGKVFIVDAMSSFGGIPMNQQEIGADYLVSSANKCIQGVPGFGFIIADRNELTRTKGWARSHSLDLYDQWLVMEEKNGKWRFTSPTHVVRAFAQALKELDDEGGIAHRYQRYSTNQRMLVRGMAELEFRCLVPLQHQSPIITSFISPVHPDYVFTTFYEHLKKRGFVIYPGKVSEHESFRIGTIGDVVADDIHRLLQAIRESCYWK